MCHAYKGFLYCAKCADKIRDILDGAGFSNQATSEYYPQDEGNIKYNGPKQCADCDCFLQNRIDAGGIMYAKSEIKREINDDTAGTACNVWAPFYGLEVKNPNTGCLEGMQCPDCGSYGRFVIAVTGWASINDDGSRNDVELDWDGDSVCSCQCGYTAEVSDFHTTPANVGSQRLKG